MEEKSVVVARKKTTKKKLCLLQLLLTFGFDSLSHKEPFVSICEDAAYCTPNRTTSARLQRAHVWRARLAYALANRRGVAAAGSSNTTANTRTIFFYFLQRLFYLSYKNNKKNQDISRSTISWKNNIFICYYLPASRLVRHLLGGKEIFHPEVEEKKMSKKEQNISNVLLCCCNFTT